MLVDVTLPQAWRKAAENTMRCYRPAWPTQSQLLTGIEQTEKRLRAVVLPEWHLPLAHEKSGRPYVPGGESNVLKVLRLTLTSQLYQGLAPGYVCRSWRAEGVSDPVDALLEGYVTVGMLYGVQNFARYAPASAVLGMLDGIDWTAVPVPAAVTKNWQRFIEVGLQLA